MFFVVSAGGCLITVCKNLARIVVMLARLPGKYEGSNNAVLHLDLVETKAELIYFFGTTRYRVELGAIIPFFQ
ncbi:hypothetical protein BEL04_12405 [Mucilaginibacter sp. PPCGB 2223]|nr:hypothetical protein BEL04_12405 [Mucilaginibacter sp. PPCGB 2223]